jgi:hypothetical protein
VAFHPWLTRPKVEVDRSAGRNGLLAPSTPKAQQPRTRKGGGPGKARVSDLVFPGWRGHAVGWDTKFKFPVFKCEPGDARRTRADGVGKVTWLVVGGFPGWRSWGRAYLGLISCYPSGVLSQRCASNMETLRLGCGGPGASTMQLMRLCFVSLQEYASNQWPRSPQKRHHRPAASTISTWKSGDFSSLAR